MHVQTNTHADVINSQKFQCNIIEFDKLIEQWIEWAPHRTHNSNKNDDDDKYKHKYYILNLCRYEN